MAEFLIIIVLASVALSVGAFGVASKHGRDCVRHISESCRDEDR
ncbi:hypothetical protein [Tardibacter chloracetimidivorans]|nr:hypothetical protein [Tardibacter chloracetimidivorans]